MKSNNGYYLVDANRYSPDTLQLLIDYHHVEYNHLGYIIREEFCSYADLYNGEFVIELDTGIELFGRKETEFDKIGDSDKVKMLIEKTNKLLAEADAILEKAEKGA